MATHLFEVDMTKLASNRYSGLWLRSLAESGGVANELYRTGELMHRAVRDGQVILVHRCHREDCLEVARNGGQVHLVVNSRTGRWGVLHQGR
ncbi:hypothetical protein [Lentzea sp. CA-135723]|uniref:hypothetical protein n=1 Tax=Lentzea sp. CA-135723 TaxID=3239950 RepID=UPI003D8F2EB4